MDKSVVSAVHDHSRSPGESHQQPHQSRAAWLSNIVGQNTRYHGESAHDDERAGRVATGGDSLNPGRGPEVDGPSMARQRGRLTFPIRDPSPCRGLRSTIIA